MKTMVQRLAICCLLLWCFMGSTMAQTDKPYVLKRQINGTDHYLAHVNNGGTWTLQDATAFNPETCLWYSGPVFNVSGTHHNYYFYDEMADKYHFLSAPLAANQDLGFSADLPTSSHLKNPDEEYYFYDWDWDAYGAGVARGHNDNGSWSTYWVEYNSEADNWKTSDEGYDITANAARFREVTITEHDKAFVWTQNNIGDLQNFSMEWNTTPASNGHELSIAIGDYSYTCTPAYTTYNFEGDNYNYQGEDFLGVNITPTPMGPISGSTASSYEWTVSGAGAEHLSFNLTTGSNVVTSNDAAPTLYYTIENTQGRKTATLTLTMTFGSGETMATVVRTAIVTVNTQCQNPAQAAAPVVNHNDVTVTWYPTATQYKVEWKKASEENWNNARSAEVGNVTSYTIHDLEQVQYDYRVIAKCGDEYLDPPMSPTGTFTPEEAPDLMIYGSVFGGGRAADVTGKTEVVIVNCDSIGAIYGGNDIAGSAGGDDGSVITLGVGTSGTGDGNTIKPIKIGSVYGGGNGYYAYGSQAFAPATSGTSTIASGDVVYAQSQSNQWDDPVWTNTGTTEVSKPTLVKTSITVTNDFVKVDSIFGGARNAFVTNNKTDANDETTTNTLTTINGGTIFAVFGGNNVGGTLGSARQKVDVTATTVDLDPTTGTTDLGRTHGIGYLFGGGNMVAGTTTEVNIFGGQLDTIFGGGNRESVTEAHLTVNCAGTNRITSAQFDEDGNVINYGWDGDALYNVHTLFGGNNRADMDGVPYVTLTSGGVGTAYGGGNAGDMLAGVPATLDDTEVDYGTYMKLESASMIVDNLYGGCQMSNVAYSTWVEIINGHVGTVYGGCNVSGDVGSTRTQPTVPAFDENDKPNEAYQEVQGATYVKVSGGTVYRDVFAGSNGYYHCNDGVRYVAGMNYGDPDDGQPAAYDPDELYIGLHVPTHNETNVKIQGGLIKGNVYAGGNLACVGFTDYTVPQDLPTGVAYPQFVGMSFVEMSAGHVMGDVYGGGRMASVFGSNSVTVSGGTIDGALYGGNDRTGQVAQITNRVLPDSYGKASDDVTDLNQLNVNTYVRVTGHPRVGTVYGGGNGDYIYDLDDPDHIQYCGITPDEPIQSNTFVDIDIDGGGNGIPAGHIGTVYGGGNGVTVIGGITVMLNVKNPDYTASTDHVGTIFGGNNKGSLTLIPDIILKEGKVHTVYGGCNKGAMYGDYTVKTGSESNLHTYQHVGSLVRLRDQYVFSRKNDDNTYTDIIQPVNAQVTGAVYGGCRMNGVTTNSMVLVEGHNNDHVNAELFGGSDISGVVGGTSMVVVNGVNGTTGTQVGDVYGGGNGNYDYDDQNVYIAGSDHTEEDLVATDNVTVVKPYCTVSRVDMMNGTADNLYAGGYAALSGTTLMNIAGGTVNYRAFGGGNLAGTTTDEYTFEDNTYSNDGSSTVNVTGGLVNGGVYGGNNLNGTIVGEINVNILGGTFGSNTTAMTDGIFGGGYGNLTQTTGNVTVTVDKLSGHDAPMIYGDVYGGSGYGDVNSPRADGQDSDDITTVNIFDGTINGDIYGGGLGQNQIGEDPAYPAHVNGKVYVNIGTGEMDDHDCPVAISGHATINGSVYGCNNVNGTPLDSVFVNIYRTAHGATIAANHYPTEELSGIAAGHWTLANLATNEQTQAYAITAVYGGGNKAAYLPPLADGQPRCATVHVWDCQENTVEDVYGGGNAADVGTTGDNGIPANTRIIIDGGRIHRMFGGGNGYSSSHNHTDASALNYNPGANIYGTASSYVYAGLIDEVYGGANQWGSIDNINLNVLSSSCCDDAVYRKVFGCANEAPINHDIVTTIGCGVGEIGDLYGGSNLASIGVDDQSHSKANVTLNLYGGNYQQVFGGSKGSYPDVPANIFGDVTLNLYGGTVVDAFGGSDQYGDIKGIVTVNVLDYEDCPLDLTNVYGGSNKADYDPWLVDGEKVASPVVNVMHIHNVDNVGGQEVTRGIRGNVYGGGYQASINANPVVNIGYDPDVVVYGTTTMADLIPDNYPSPNQMDQLHNFPHAFISGKAFGGGDLADVTGHTTVNMRQVQSQVDTIFGGGNQAGVYGSEINVYNGKVVNGVYGGCNLTGTVGGDIVVNMLGGTLGTTTDNIVVFGGGLGTPTTTTGNVTVNIGDTGYAPNIYGTVYGGSALGSVNSDTEDLTKVWLKSGTVNGRVFGGGLGQKNGVNGATSDVAAQVNGNIQVIGDGTDVTIAVFGANDQNGDPAGTVAVTINDGIIGNVVGGGSVADYSAPASDVDYPYVTINGGTVTNKVVGGGNEANVEGNTRILVTGGTIGTSTDAGSGVYGGCNTTGTVTGNTTINLTGGTIGVSSSNTANIHGGGYGQPTSVTGNVTVTFGEIVFDDDTNEEIHTDNLKLFGDLYGGSALGSVNTTGSDKTTVNILNGIIDGAVYGGGLGQKNGVNGATSDVEAPVNGSVQVNIGACNGSGCGDAIYNPDAADGYTGMADLINCDVFGCNNINGSPQDAVRVDVYKTYHATEGNNANGSYAINQVFGGGNESDYMINEQNVHVRIHACDNTIWRTFGGGNAADVYGVRLVIEGGRFDYVFGGGNGERGALYAANVGIPGTSTGGGIQTTLGGGTINQWVNGSNLNGQIVGGISSIAETYCGQAVVEDYFLGSNMTDYHGDVNTTILCDANMPQFVNLYGGCNRAQFYGNITINIEGGVFYNVFGGSKGWLGDGTTPAYASNILDYDDGLGNGGNIIINVKGGTIGNLFGGCNLNGNVQGKITINVQSESTDCPLYLGNIYGAGNMTSYKPGYNQNGVFVNSYLNLQNGTVNTPEINVKKGRVGGEQTLMLDPATQGTPNEHYLEYEGNVYGGGNHGDVKAHPIVKIGDKNHPNDWPVTIEGNVYGGGREGKVEGNTQVIIVPTE